MDPRTGGGPDRSVRDIGRSLSPEQVMGLSRATTAALGLAQLDRYWVDQARDIARDSDSGRRKARSDALRGLGNEMSRQLETLVEFRHVLVAAAQAISADAQVAGEDWPPGSVPDTNPFKRIITDLTGPDVGTVTGIGRSVLSGLTDPSFPDFVDQTIAAVAAQTGVPQTVIEHGATLLTGEHDVTPTAVVDAIMHGVDQFGVDVPPGFSQAASLFSAAAAGGAHGLDLLPALGGLIGSVFGVPAIGAAIGAFIEWVVHRVLAEQEHS